MAELPSMPLFIADYEAATAHLTVEEDGAYTRLLRLCWMTPGCSIPDDDAWITRRMRVDQDTYNRVVRPIIDEFFSRENGRVFQRRLMKEFKYVSRVSSERKKAGKRGAANKWQKTKENTDGKATDLPIANDKQTDGKPMALTLTLTPTSSEDKSSGVSPPILDPVKVLFDSGIAILAAAKVSEKQARSMLGKWRRDHGDGKVIEALHRAQVEAASEPVAFIEALLRKIYTPTNGPPGVNYAKGFQP